MSLPQEVAASYNTLKGTGVRYAIYPAIDDTDISVVGSFTKLVAGAAKLMTAAGAVSIGVMPAVEYWICGILVQTVNAELTCLRITSDAAGLVVLFEDFLDCTAATANLNPFMLPYPIRRPAAALNYGVVGTITGGNNTYVALLCATGL